MKMLISSNKGSNDIPPLVNIIDGDNPNNIAYGDDEKCKLLNKYFSSISTLNDENIPLPDFESRSDVKINNLYIEIEEIVDVIKSLDPNKASGPDQISHKMLKICPEAVAVPLQIIFNKSLEQCRYPET